MNHYYLEKPQFLEMAAELAGYMVAEIAVQGEICHYVQTDAAGNESYTEAGQDLFNAYIDAVTAMLNAGGIHADNDTAEPGGNACFKCGHENPDAVGFCQACLTAL